MKKIVILLLTLFFSTFSYSGLAQSDLNDSLLPIERTTLQLLPAIDSTLNRLEIYDPALSNLHFGLGFPGSAVRPIYFILPESCGVNPIFNSYAPLLFSPSNQSNFNFKKPVTQIQYVIFPSIRTEQYLDLFHSRNIGKNLNLGIKLRKIKSNGYYLKQGSNISNVTAYISSKTKTGRYLAYSSLAYNNIVSIENGGVQNDSLDYSSRSIALQSLPVYLEDAKNRMSLWGGKIAQTYNFGPIRNISTDTLIQKNRVIATSHLYLELNYSKQSLNYVDQFPLSGFYENVFKDSSQTNDKFSQEKFESDFSFALAEILKNGNTRKFIPKVGIRNETIAFETSEFVRTFTNTSAYLYLKSNSKDVLRYAFQASYFIDGYNSKNYKVQALIGRIILDSTKFVSKLDLIGSIINSNPDYVYQHYYSNHFKWENNFHESQTINLNLRFESKKLLNLTVSLTKMINYVYLDTSIAPVQLSKDIDLISGRLNKLFHLGNFHLDAILVYQRVMKGKDVLGLPELFTRNSIYWGKLVFKKAMDLQIGFDVLYTTKYYGLSYQPSLNAFYFQSSKKIGAYPAIDFFVNFKLRQARVFFKVDHLNYGLNSGKYEFVPGYLIPGRTFRFGLSWLFIN